MHACRGATDTGGAHMRQPRPEFDRFQESLCGLLGEPLPRMPHLPSPDGSLQSHPLRDLEPHGEHTDNSAHGAMLPPRHTRVAFGTLAVRTLPL